MAAEVTRQPSGMEMVVALLRYLGRSAIQLDKQEVARKLVDLLPKEGGVLMQTMAEEWIEEGKTIGLREGEEKGRKEGLQEGRQETLRATILRILHRRFSPNDLLFQQVEQQLSQLHDESVLNGLVDSALDVMVLPEFALRLRELVSTPV